ncbi:MAG TPA: hypothetical protein ENL15_01420 [Firmicutes bacterium]|nr:hypothetical protein [Bacillota bacterium]
MLGLALFIFFFHTVTGGRYASIPVRIFAGLKPGDDITVHVMGNEYNISGKGHSFLKNIRVEKGCDSLRLSEDLSLVINNTTYALGLITSPDSLTFIKCPDGHLYLYRGDLLSELGISLQKGKQHEK